MFRGAASITFSLTHALTFSLTHRQTDPLTAIQPWQRACPEDVELEKDNSSEGTIVKATQGQPETLNSPPPTLNPEPSTFDPRP